MKSLFKNRQKLSTILSNKEAQDPEANEKRAALKEMVRSYLLICKGLGLTLEQICIIFKDEIGSSAEIRVKLCKND